MTDWRPIETADLDAIDDVLISDGDYVTLGYFNGPEVGWMDSTMQDGSTPAPPTHWQPKPAPPRIPDAYLADGTPVFHCRAAQGCGEWLAGEHSGAGDVRDRELKHIAGEKPPA